MDNIKLFFEKIKADTNLQEKLKSMQGKTQDEAMEAVLAVANANGFEITKEDFLKYVEVVKESAKKNGELNEEELDSVAGGGPVEWIIGSVGSIGLMCAASLIGKAFDTCGLDHPETIPGSRY